MQTTHTPSPWSLSDEDSPLLSGADGAYIAEVFSRTANGNLRPHYAADSRLIAAAPDLLAALVEVTDRLTVFSTSANLNTRLALEAARAAIARATA